ALREGPHALSTGGRRLEGRGMVALLQPGCTRLALHADRLGPIRDARLAAKLHQGCRAVALQALEVSAHPTPWLPQATTALVLSGADADTPPPPGAPRPASGQRKEGRGALPQVLLRLGVRGDGGAPAAREAGGEDEGQCGDTGRAGGG